MHETERNENIPYQNLWDTDKPVLRTKFTAIKEGKTQIKKSKFLH